jgi:hypothetical protein
VTAERRALVKRAAMSSAVTGSVVLERILREINAFTDSEDMCLDEGKKMSREMKRKDRACRTRKPIDVVRISLIGKVRVGRVFQRRGQSCQKSI